MRKGQERRRGEEEERRRRRKLAIEMRQVRDKTGQVQTHRHTTHRHTRTVCLGG
jgi:hypothetical protein